MSRLIMWNLVTLDGYFEGVDPWDLSWHESAWCPELEELSQMQLQSAERLIFGRVTYEGMAAYWATQTGPIADGMNNLPKVVASRTLKRAEWNNATLLSENVIDKIRELKSKGDGDSYVFGSGILCRALMEHGLFDEYRIGIAPIVLGNGRRLFTEELARLPLQLVEAKPLSTGCILARYTPRLA